MTRPFLLLPVLLLICAAARAGTADYLERNATAFDPATGRGADSIETAGRTFFLLGDMHGVAAINAADLALLRRLQERAGVRYYVSEISYGYARLLNRYLDTGDERILDFLFAHMGHTSDRSIDKRRFWSELRAWNDTLAPADRVRIVGIDLERFDPRITLANIREIVGRWPLLSAGDFEDLSLLLGNLDQRYRIMGDRAHLDEERDAAQYDNLRSIAARLPPGAFYGRMGSAHVLQRRFDGCDWFSSHLESAGSPWAGRVVGIFPLFDRCERLQYARGAFRVQPCEDDPALVGAFAGAAKGPLTLFRLDRPDSPYRSGDAAGWTWSDNRMRGEGRPPALANYFQYVLLFEGQRAARPFPGT